MEYFNVFDPQKDRVFKGADQDWYGSWWRRVSGCGPTTASNLIWYLSRSAEDPDAPAAQGESGARSVSAAQGESAARDKRDAVFLMNQVWKYVTPGKGGVNNTELLRSGVARYAEAAGLRLRAENLDVPGERSARPPLRGVIRFIGAGLAEDLPVSFLNLHNGAEKQLEKWHWVTITAMDAEADGGAASLDILDNCGFLRVDLGRWLATTVKGGGFVRFSRAGE
jgi:hypothetical protein